MKTRNVIITNPNYHYTPADEAQIPEMVGIIPYWAEDANQAGLTLKEGFAVSYGMPLYEMTGGTISNKGVYQFPEDPELQPLMSITNDTETCYIYPYGIVGIVGEDNSQFITRMD